MLDEREIWFIPGGNGQFLENVHSVRSCAGPPCVIHSPSDHHMRDWPLYWRNDASKFERICPHGIGHPDPDDLTHQDPDGERGVGIHGCDGCCHR